MSPSNINAYLTYWSSSLSDVQAHNVADVVAAIFKCTLDNPGLSVSQLDLFGELSRSQVLLWNSSKPEPVNNCLHTMFQQCAASQPDACAVDAWDGKYTYAELDAISTRLALQLVELGVGPEVIVPFCLEKSVWAVICMLAVFKAGGACVPLLVTHPKARLQSIIKDTKATIILTQAHLLDQVSHLINTTISVDQLGLEKTPLAATSTLGSRSSPNSAAFIVYTSGSTGTPKGIVLEHQSLCTSLLGNGVAMGIGPTTRVLQFASYTFDVCLEEILSTLMLGGCVCIPSEADRMGNLTGVINSFEITWAELTPTVAMLLEPAKVPTLKTMALSGEQVSKKVVQKWADHCQLMNSYGPSECSVTTSCNPKLSSNGEPANIGRGIACTMWIVDPADHNKLYPVGCIGELLIEGPILAREYLNDPVKTSTSFIENPSWSMAPNSSTLEHRRFYKTGDLVRYTSDGTIKFIGRKDTQVKLRGQRLELSEIEYHLSTSIPSAKHVAVEICTPGEHGNSKLIAAFFCLEGERSNEVNLLGLRDALEDVLPPYMVPSLFVPMTEMPLTASGKLDRKALQRHVSLLSDDDVTQYSLADIEKRAPATTSESTLQILWSEVLGIPLASVGADDHFFRIGGDSVGAMKLVTAAAHHGLAISVANIFQQPILSNMASLMSISDNASADVGIEPFALWTGIHDTVAALGDVAAQCGISQELIEDVYPCTPLQEGLMALTNRRSAAYVARIAFKLPPSAIDLERFQQAWTATIANEPILRTRILNTTDSGSLQVVVSDEPVWKSSPSIQAYVEEDSSSPITYGVPLTRYAIVGSGLERFFVWTVHHAIYDGWSLPFLFDQVERRYRGEPVEPTTPYKTFMAHLASIPQNTSKDFWTAQLADGEPSTFPVLPSPSYESHAEHFRNHFIKLPRGAASLDYTPSTLFRAAWALVMSAYCDSDDIVFGVTLSGRNAPVHGITEMVGPTIATVPLRVCVNRADTPARFLEEMHNQAVSMIPFEHFGLQNIRRLPNVKAVHLNFQSVLVFQPADGPNNGESLLNLERVAMDMSGFDTYPLSIECNSIGENAFSVTAQYDKAILRDVQVENLLTQLEHMLHVLTSNTNSSLDNIDMCSPHHQAKIFDWNCIIPQTIDDCIHWQVARQAIARPDAEAISSWDGKVTYQELDILSTRLSLRLIELEVIGPEVIVPLCFSKSAYAVVAMLAILKAGGAYTSLDPSHPKSRIEAILHETRAKIVIVMPSHAHLFQNFAGHVVQFGPSILDSLPAPQPLGSRGVSPRNSAIITFTSGSTGKPKGIVVEHQSVCTAIKAHGENFNFRPGLRVFQFAAYTFDVSNSDIFTTLSYGGCVCIPSDEERMSDLPGTMRRLGTEYSMLTPSVASLLSPTDIPSLQTLGIGGEVPTKDVISTWNDSVKLLNSYGPAECTIFSSQGGLTAKTPTNIGNGAGSLLWIVNPNNHNILSPIGCPGEILIEGPIVSRGYLNDAQKTTNAFIENPAWASLTVPTQRRRFYKTGDLAQYDAENGAVQYIGRTDTQVKLRGQRIELSEIEYHLKSAIAEATKVAVEVVNPGLQGDNKALAAFFTNNTKNATTEAGLDIHKLRATLAQVLPPYMVPSIFIPLLEFPITGSGKLDRKSLRRYVDLLPADEISRLSSSPDTQKRAPATEMELLLQGLWSDVIKIPLASIGADDHFFQIGGDSIGAMRLVRSVDYAGLSLTVALIFQHPILSDLAEKITVKKEAESLESEPYALWKQGEDFDSALNDIAAQCNVSRDIVDDVYPCTPLQEGLMALTARRSAAYVARNVFKLSRSIHLKRFRDAWTATVAHEPILRTRIVYLEEHGSLQVVVRDEAVWQSSSSLSRCIEENTNHTMAYGGPLNHFAIVDDTTTGESYFVWTIHHAIYDGWTLQLLLSQVRKRYEGSPIYPAPAYKSFIAHLLHLEQTNHTEQNDAEKFWLSQLSDGAPSTFPHLPSLAYEPRADRTQTKTITLHQQTKSGPFFTSSTILRAAWALVLSAYTNSDDVIFGTVLSGRNARVSGITRIVGPTVTTVPVRVRLNRDITLQSFLQQIQDQSVSMIPFEHFGLQKMRHLSKKFGTNDTTQIDFQNLLVVQPAVENGVNEEHRLGLERLPTDIGDFDTYALILEFTIAHGESTVTAVAQYDPAILDDAQIITLLAQLEHVVLTLNESDRSMWLSDINLCSEHDKTQIMKWNCEQPTATQQCVHWLIREQCSRTPDAEAICSWDGTFTYKELYNFSTRLAVQLTSLGVGPDIIVPLCFSKSAYAVVAVMAVLEAGGAYAFVDPASPKDRISNILTDTGAQLLITMPAHAHLFEGALRHILQLDASALGQLQLEPKATVPVKSVEPHQPAIVVFTPGSTEEHRGIIIEHRSLSTALEEHGRVIGFQPGRRVLQSAPYTTSASNSDILTTLIYGGCICIPSEEETSGDLAAIARKLVIDLSIMTPSVAALLRPSDIPSLRTLGLYGEAMSKDLLLTWAEEVDLFSCYGLPESSIWSSQSRLDDGSTTTTKIGRGSAGVLWIVDPADHNRLSPIGCAGELLVEGPILARGYLHDAQKTTENFIEDPDWTEGSSQCRRFFKTGDLARYESDGSIRYLGRKDFQAKLRAQRIDLFEIERQLMAVLPQARQTAVDVVTFDAPKVKKLLVAFFTLQNDYKSDNIEPRDIQKQLAQSVPSYMVPSVFITMPKLPVSVSGRLDRKALQLYARQLPEQELALCSVPETTKCAPATPMEVVFQELWAKSLKATVTSIGADDNFFRMGGDSITAMRLVIAAGRVNLALSVADIFQHPILSDMAKMATSRQVGVTATDTAIDEPYSLWTGIQGDRETPLNSIAAQCDLTPDLVADVYPCTPLQEGLMTLTNRQSSAYVNRNVFKLPFSLDIDRFRNSWAAVIASEPILRTRIIDTTEWGSLQVVVSHKESVEWKSSPSLDAYLREDSAQHTIYGAPLSRLAIVGGSRENLHFVWTIHHAIYDGWSVPLVFEQVQQHYHGGTLRSSTPYRRFIAHIGSIERTDIEGFWAEQLGGGEPSTFPTLPSLSYQPRPHQTLTRSINLSRQAATSTFTPSTLIRAAWSLVLSAYSDYSDDVVFGVTVSGRNAAVQDIAQMVGPTIATVPIRIRFNRQNSVTEFLQAVQEQTVAMIPYEHFGLQNIRRVKGIEPVCVDFQSLLVVQPAEENTSDQDFLGLTRLPVDLFGFDTYSLILECNVGNNGFTFCAQYDPVIIDSCQAENLLATLEYAVQIIQENPGRLLSDVDICSPHNKTQILKWNAKSPHAEEKCVHWLINEQTMAQPDAQAICAWDANFTYRELDILSTRLALQLISLGIKPEDIVPVCFHKSAYTIIAMLAVLKAGGAYTAVDPAHPKSRLQEIMQKTKAKVIVALPEYCHLFEDLLVHTVRFGETFMDQLPPAASDLDNYWPATPKNPAIVVFTSGSTGKPKGIVLEHQSFCTVAREHGRAVGFARGVRVFQFAAYTFDVSNSEIFTTLINGGCVCIPSDHDRMSDLAAAARRFSVNWMFLTPSVASLLTPDDIPTLRTLALGGEVITADLVSTWSGSVRLINSYGPAECSIWTSQATLDNTISPNNVGSAIGANTWIVHAGNHNQLVPIGCVGELLVEGPIVARGYLDDPGLTAASFIENPTWCGAGLDGQGRRFYKTGDLACNNPDGTLTFAGRKDTQVKLRGQRIELSEVEHHLKAAIPQAKHVAAEIIVHQGNKFLAAFFCLLDDMTLRPDELQAIQRVMTKSLPPYMVPALFIPLPDMPMTVSRKINRKDLQRHASLLPADELLHYSKAEMRVPSTPMELKLQELWSAAINIPASSIGADEHFLRAGGDSIAAMRLSAAAAKANLAITVEGIFNHPILSDMAKIAVSQTNSEMDDATDNEPFGLWEGYRNMEASLLDIASQCNVPKNLVEDVYPCTPLQEGLMALTTRKDGAYINRNVFKLPSSLDLPRFKKAWQATVAFEPILRTRIVHTTESGSIQVVLREQATWHQYDSLEEYLGQDIDRSISYGSHLSYYAIVGNAKNDSLHFVWTLHHTLYDGWSLPLVFEQVERRYNAEPIPSTPRYRNFIANLISADRAASEAFWTAQLAGKEASTFPQLPSSSYLPRADRAARRSFNLPQQAVSPFTTSTLFRASWALVTAVYTNSDANHVVFGATLSGRNANVHNITKMVGPTITTVPICVQLNRSKSTVVTFLRSVQEQSTAMIPFEHFGLQNIRRLPGVESAHVDFQNLLVVQIGTDGARDSKEFMGLTRVHTDMSDFDTYALVLECNRETDDVYTLVAQYDSTLVNEQHMENILTQFEHTFRILSDSNSANKLLSDIDFCNPYDKAQILEWNNVRPEPVDECVHWLVKRQLAVQPLAEAICSWDGTFTYSDLDVISTRLGIRLVELGVGPENIVPICFNKSAYAVISMMAVLKAGGAYTALDPSHPRSRLEEILRDTGGRVVVAAPAHVRMFEGLADVDHIVPFGKSTADILPPIEGAHVLDEQEISPNNSAIVVYTSGSTGRPKGIVLEHKSFCTVAATHGPAVGFRPGLRVFQFAAYTFDVSNSEIFTTLVNGGCVCIPSDVERMNDIAGAARRLAVGWTFLTPSVAGLLRPEDIPSLQTLALGGEAISEDLMTCWSLSKKVRLINSYGPAECSIWTSQRQLQDGIAPANIGRGVGCILWVVNPEDHDHLVPIGSVGELLVEGPILARHYLNDIDKTTAAYISCPIWAPESGRRFYKTGDLVRYDFDGTIHFVGRKDNQVKLHGQRIEISDIEHHLSTHPLIQQSMVLVSTDTQGGKRLVAVAVANRNLKNEEISIVDGLEAMFGSGKDTAVSDWQTHLRMALPAYMVPDAWFVISKLPLTVNGKADRKALTMWIEKLSGEAYSNLAYATSSDTEIDAPMTSMEIIIQEILGRVLNLPNNQIPMNKSFMALGGDSITAMQVVSRCRGEGISISLQNILRGKSIRELATKSVLTDEKPSARVEETEAEFNPAPIQQMYFDSLAMVHKSDSYPAGAYRYNQSFLVSLTKQIKSNVVAKAIEKLVWRHSMLRARFSQDNSGRWTQRITSDTAKSYQFQDSRANSEGEVAAIVSTSQAGIDIQNGPLLRADLIDVPGKSQLLFMVAHHLVIDLVSWRVLVQDLEQFLETGSITPTKPLSFQSWSMMQAKYAQEHLVPSRSLPFDVPMADISYWGMNNHANRHGDAIHQSFTVDKELTSALLNSCHTALRTTPVDVFLAMLVYSFQKVFNNRPLPTVFLEGHGRQPWNSNIDLSETVGWFTTIAPLQVYAEGDIVHMVRQVKDVRHNIPDLGWSYFASRYLNDEGKEAFGNHWPMEILFNYHGQYQNLEREDSLIKLAELKPTLDGIEAATGDIGPEVERLALFDVSVSVEQGVALFGFTYNSHMKYQEQISMWIHAYQECLKEVTVKLLQIEYKPTLADFPRLPTSYQGLESLQNDRLGRIGLRDLSIVEDVYPCTPMQQGLLISQSRSAATYEVEYVFELIPTDGTLVDVERLARAWETVVNRHTILRTLFIESVCPNMLFDQVVLQAIKPPIDIIDAQDRDVFAVMAGKANLSRDQDVLHHFTLCKTSDDRVICKIEISHALVDGASIDVLCQELAQAYDGKQQISKIPFSDYISYIQSQPQQDSIKYWKAYLGQSDPCYLPNLTENTTEREQKEVAVELVDSSKLFTFCRSHGTTPASVIQTAWGLVLRSYTGSDDVLFGYIASGRDVPLSGIADAVGLFINLLVCRVNAAPGSSLHELVEKFKADYVAGLVHQHCALAEIQHALDLSGQALFNTVMSIQIEGGSTTDDEFEAGITFSPIAAQDPTEVSYRDII